LLRRTYAHDHQTTTAVEDVIGEWGIVGMAFWGLRCDFGLAKQLENNYEAGVDVALG
jgi:hypothetical protein